MKISQILAQGPTFSFEFFPPKDAAGEDLLWGALQDLAPLAPDFVSVTYGANGSQRERTIGLTHRIATQTGLRTMGHLTCVDQRQADLIEVVDNYGANGLDLIFAIRGDMPGGPTIPWQAHPEGLANATELVELVRSRGQALGRPFCVGVAAFPDPHPAQSDPDLDARILMEKWQAGADFAITQLFFSVQAYLDLVDRVRSIGCEIPIIPGIMPITLISQVETFARLSGAPIPSAVTARLEAVADDPAAVVAVGTQIGVELSAQLLAAGAPGLHFFTQNRSKATLAIWSQIKD
ncbi:MAG: methylenetetrahydrofolate reductase [Propionibacteriaceae bacterium]|nr:methylenetetrahydrofolate reductase [Propionibacteriaceae bacterium]